MGILVCVCIKLYSSIPIFPVLLDFDWFCPRLFTPDYDKYCHRVILTSSRRKYGVEQKIEQFSIHFSTAIYVFN